MKKKLTPAQKALVIVPFTKLPATKAWKATSEYVRKSLGGRCYTCDKLFPYEKLVAGHFIEKRGNANTYFDLDNLRPQCQWYCNRMGGGRKDIYANNLIKEKGPKIIEDLFRLAGKARMFTKADLEKIEGEMKERIASLASLENTG